MQLSPQSILGISSFPQTQFSLAVTFHFPQFPSALSSVQLLSSVQFSSVAQSSLTVCDPMNCSMPGLPVHHQLPEFTQTHVHWVGDAFQPSYPLSSPSSPVPNPAQHQSLFQWVNSSHEVAKVLEFQFCVQLLVTPRTIAHQAPLSMEFSRQDYWSGLPFPCLLGVVLFLILFHY